MSRRTNLLIAAIAAALIIANLGLTVRNLAASETGGESLDAELPEFRALMEVFEKVQQHYVDPSRTKPQSLWRGAINGMLGELDPYSVYMPADRFAEFKESTEGTFGGLGISIEMVGGWVTVISPLPDTPAFRAGIKPGDRIYKIEGESTYGISIHQAVKRLKGDPGTKVRITVARQNPDLSVEDLEFTIERDIIDVPAVDASSAMVTQTVGYIRLNDFTQDAAEELSRKVKEFKEQGMKALVLDLRNNSGGLLDVAIDVCGLFLPRNTVVVKVEQRGNGRAEQKLRCTGGQEFADPLAVLVNEFSASASEIVAGCMQDLRRGIVLGPQGENTFGKGSVQTIIPLQGGAALKLTTARYLTPLGRNIHEKGIRPDIWVEIPREEIIALSQQRRFGYLPSGIVEDSLEREAAPAETVSVTREITAEDVFRISPEDRRETKTAPKQVYDRLLLEAVNQLRARLLLAEAK